jgi:hypothetical protein
MRISRRVARSSIFRLLADNAETWSTQVGRPRRIARRKAILRYYLLPALLSAPLIFIPVCIANPSPLLSGLSVFTALLFGLMFLVFNLGVTIRKDSAVFTNAHGVRRVVSDLRANVTYTACIAVALVIVTVFALATSPSDNTLPSQWTPLLSWLGIHMVFNLLTILIRVRQ